MVLRFERMKSHGYLYANRSDSAIRSIQGRQETSPRGVLYFGSQDMPGLRVITGDEDDGQGRWAPNYRPRQYRLHVCGEHHLLQHFVGATLDAHAVRQQRV